MASRFTAANVTVAVSNYNGAAIVGSCLESIRQLNAAPAEIVVLDDGSTDGSVAYLREHFPSVRVIEMGVNSGGVLNKLRNRALAEARTDFVFLVDNDVTLRADCLDELLKGLETLPHAAVCLPRTLYERDPTMIYQDGQVLHYAGTSLAKNRNFPVARADNTPRLTIGWGVQLIDRAQAADVGNFSEGYIIGWGDDAEFNHKMNLLGHFCYHVPSAVVYHKRVTGAKRYLASVRNRWRFLLEFYQARTLVLCVPALAVYELSLILFLLKKREFRQYRAGMKFIWANRREIRTVRRSIQRRRVMRDRELMTSGTIFIAAEYMDSTWLAVGYRLMNAFLNGYWVLVRGLL
ncbi:MAG TPA: glycosyltransferase family 2 protein [Vicinamibacterales bacterium]|nr:glycosyltransferase family 2 protein [Vicinamibacterales bacterium]